MGRRKVQPTSPDGERNLDFSPEPFENLSFFFLAVCSFHIINIIMSLKDTLDFESRQEIEALSARHAVEKYFAGKPGTPSPRPRSFS